VTPLGFMSGCATHGEDVMHGECSLPEAQDSRLPMRK
jgi:hypothetical protein